MKPFEHKTVLLAEAVEALAVHPAGTYVDCTVGGAGHSERIATQLNEHGLLIGLDQDQHALDHARSVLCTHLMPARVVLQRENFRNLSSVLSSLDVDSVDGVLFDLGVSSPQLDDRQRGFSYWDDAPLDMRMDQRQSRTAAHWVNESSVETLQDVLSTYGEERFARRIAQRIVAQRLRQPIETAAQLVTLVKEAIPAAKRREGGHPARRTFQALRIAVNDEVQAFEEALTTAVRVVRPGGRIVVITFHSLEDRLCKQRFASWVQRCTCPPQLALCVCGTPGLLQHPLPKPITPSAQEIEHNARARSATLRYAIRSSDIGFATENRHQRKNGISPN